jgi:PHD/YefM family antitoxin component YafN of YafNO toxin-antitoxin module
MKARNLAVPVEEISGETLKESLPEVLEQRGVSLLVIHNGEPAKVLIDYEEFIEILDILDELNDPVLLEEIALGRKEYAETGGIPLEKLKEDLGL